MKSLFIIIILLTHFVLNAQEFRGHIETITVYDLSQNKTPISLKILSQLNSLSIADLDTTYGSITICSDTLIRDGISKKGSIITSSIQIGSETYLYNEERHEYFIVNLVPPPQESYKKNNFKKVHSDNGYNYVVKSSKFKKHSPLVEIDKSLHFPESHAYEGEFSRFFSPIGAYTKYTEYFGAITEFKYQVDSINCAEFVSLLQLPKTENAVSRYQDELSIEAFSNTETQEPIPLPKNKLIDRHGNPTHLNEYLGSKIILIDFWASWCRPCLEEMHFLKDIAIKFSGEGVNLVSISLDESTNLPKLRNVIDKNKMDWTQLLLQDGFQSQLFSELNIKAIPRLIMLNEKGEIINTNCPLPSNENLNILITNALNRSQ
jgi:thiol-disulfide isomerase/thioredoxin